MLRRRTHRRIPPLKPLRVGAVPLFGSGGVGEGGPAEHGRDQRLDRLAEQPHVNVGVTLQIAPHVSTDGFVTSHVFGVVSSVTG
jgi:hypothetical protein